MIRRAAWLWVAAAIVCVVGAAVYALAPTLYGQSVIVGRHGGPSLRIDDSGVRLSVGGDRTVIGASVRDVDAADVSREKLTGLKGAVIVEVHGDGPAAAAGLKSGDVILEFDGETVRSAAQLTRLVRETPAERTVSILVSRGGSTTTLSLAPRAAQSLPRFRWDEHDLPALRELRELPQLPELDWFVGRNSRLGIGTQNLTPELAAYFGVQAGVLIASVREGTPAAAAGLKAGDVITAIGGVAVSSASELRRELARTEGGTAVELRLTRDKQERSVTVTPEGRTRRRSTARITV